VLLVLSSADNRWNDLPLHPVFVGFMVESANYLSGADRIPDNYVTGDSLPLSLIGSASGQVVGPDGSAILSLADTAQAQQIKLNNPGFYEVYTPQGETLVAVNIDPRESGIERMGPDILGRWQEATGRQDNMTDTADMTLDAPPLQLWRWLLLLLAIVTIGESLLANRHLSSPLRTG
jgi:hypothetical protein